MYPTGYDALQNRWSDTLIGSIQICNVLRLANNDPQASQNNTSSEISKNSVQKISVYPNPLSNEGIIRLPENINSDNMKFGVSDITGRDVTGIFEFDKLPAQGNYIIKTNKSVNGTYYLWMSAAGNKKNVITITVLH